MFTDRLLEAARYAGAGDSQSDIARALGVSRQRVSMWFLRGSVPSGEDAVKIAGTLGVRPEWLLNGDGPMLPDPATDALNSEERDLIKNYRSAAPKVRDVIRGMVRAAKKVAIAGALALPAYQPHPAEASILHNQNLIHIVRRLFHSLRAVQSMA